MTPSHAARTSRLTRVVRVARVAAHFAHAAGIAGVGYPVMTPARRRLALQRWSARLIQHLGARLTIHGEPPRDEHAPLMLVANHVSWLDIFAINAAIPARFVAKSEIRGWPLVGWLCVKADTVFIERKRRRDLARLDEVMSNALRGQSVMGVFLEGTTTDGSEVLPFKSSLLRPALAVNVPIHPVAIQYRRADGTLCTEAAYDGDKSAYDTFRSMLTQHEFHVHVHFLPAVSAAGVHRKVLAAQLREQIVTRLNV
jgi:1-acyl-sn-glycerol-3-phosphate acyltransferase